MKKRLIALLLVMAMICSMAVLTGCNGKEEETKSNDYVVPEAGFNMDEEVTITFTHTMGARLQEVLNNYIVEFNKIYPNITVEHVSAGGWSDINGQINTEIAGGNAPNIAYCYPDHVAMYNIAKAVVVLDNLIASDKAVGDTGEIIGLTQEQKDDFIASYYNEGLVYGDNKMYTMPLNKSTEVMYYNKTFFEENNLSVPTTWDELWAVCEQIKAIDPACFPLGYDAEDNWFITLCEQMGTGYTTAAGDDHYLVCSPRRSCTAATPPACSPVRIPARPAAICASAPPAALPTRCPTPTPATAPLPSRSALLPSPSTTTTTVRSSLRVPASASCRAATPLTSRFWLPGCL